MNYNTLITNKRCPKCSSTMLVLEQDHRGPFISCVSCGWIEELGAPTEPLRRTGIHGPRHKRRDAGVIRKSGQGV